MPLLTAPSTLAVANAIVAYGAALTYPSTALVYKLCQLGAIKDIVDQVANGAACLEVYANNDDSQRHEFGGRIRDSQSWFLMSLVSMDDAAAGEALIYNVRDALVQPFQQHATLGNAGSVFHAQIKSNTAKFVRVFRNGIELRGHILEIETVSEWQIPAPGVIS
ncbi:MAG: hypothetical protein PVS3B3_36840 [Ktedonobacteraceae bacterium]